MTNQTNEDLTKDIYEAMQVSYLSERHDAIKKLIQSHTNKAISNVLDRMEEFITYGEYDICSDDSECGDVIPYAAIKQERNRLKEI